MVKEKQLPLMEQSMVGNSRMGNEMVKGHSLSLMELKGLVSSEKVDLGTLLTGIKTETS